MRPQYITQTGVGTSDPVRLNYRQADFKVGVGIEIDGVVNYTLQHSFDDPSIITEVVDQTWFDNSDPDLVLQTVKRDTNYSAPIQMSRILNVGAGTVTATYLQGN
tara:strand:- start:2660 stop:2974 length:315 start_codon:yes stop_codon:yes gene_type:complete